ncbi:hypothetical protein GJ744_005411 [Endocarpon pusillum]|uniref:Fe2OG dioxygenase domain-containing protein n=1 Tax=Endocarpon pusillum TaxID=364733 RepID=A0A8H7A8S8_9EURO|nr:hypothetical protein GJ744_005411 [Endocarpon pusillum]
MIETLRWFRQTQGGLYCLDMRVRGILLVKDEFGGLGHFDDRVLITRLARQTNQIRSTLSSVTKAASNTLREQAMVGLVISRDFQKLPVTFRDGESYGVSGFWHLSHVFAVRSEGPKEGPVHTDLMACLVYSGPRETMWWNVAEDETATNAVQVLKEDETFDKMFEKEECSLCSEESLTIFAEGWVCTNVLCSSLGRDQSGQAPKTKTYSQRFLQPWVSQEQMKKTAPPLLPDLLIQQPQLTNDRKKSFETLRDFWRGWVCPVCATMNRRLDYHQMVCPCGKFSAPSPVPNVTLGQVTKKEFLELNAKDKLPPVTISDNAVKLTEQEFTDKYAIYTWEFEEEAKVTALFPRAAAHAGPNGNDKVFEEMQKKTRSGAIPMKRVPVGKPKSRGLDLTTRQFCANFGRDYNASMVVSTTPFEQADPLVGQLVRRAEAVVLGTMGINVSFNEALLLAYLPDMSIRWHDDGEADLGDTVISHSVGGNCVMKFAMKGEYWWGKRDDGQGKVTLTPDDPHLPGCPKMQERRALLDKYGKGELTKQEYESQLRDVVRDFKVNRENVSHLLMSVTVPHGGYIIMHGKNMQKYYKHSAEAKELLRFVITMRHIGDKHQEQTLTSRRAVAEARVAADSVLGKRKERSD